MKRKILIFLVFSIFLLFILSLKEVTIRKVTADEVYQMLQKNPDMKDLVIIDVRTPEEYKSVHIDKAINIDFYSSNFKKELAKLDRKKIYILYCRSGNRTGKTVKIMEELGFKNIYDMGALKDWIDKGYPVVKR